MKVSSKYFLYFTLISLLELIVIFFAQKPYDAYSVIIFSLLTFGLFGFRSVYCFHKVTTYIKHNAPALYNKYVVRPFGFRMFDSYLIRDQKAIDCLDDEARNCLRERKLLSGYVFISFLLFTVFSLAVVLK